MARDPATPPRTGLDPTFDVDAAPRVAQSNSLWPIAFGIVGALALGVIVFLQLDASRTATETARLASEQAERNAEAQRLAAASIPTAPVIPAYVPVQPEPTPVVETAPLVEEQPPPPPVPAGPTQAELDRLRAPALVVDLGEYKAPAPGTPAGTPGAGVDPAAVAGAVGAAANQSMNADERFAQKLGVGVGGSSKPARASKLIDQSNTIIEGSVIAAVLETALNSDLPGYVRAVVTRDVKGFDGSKTLVPRGSRLIGQYKSGVALGQSRTFVIWTRLIRPDGATIELAAPATDGLGRGGLDGDVDTHFFERFGGAILLTLLNIGGAAIADSTDTSIVIASTRAGVDAGSSSLMSGANIGPTVTVPQGSPVRVFVSQDLDFSTVGPVKTGVSN